MLTNAQQKEYADSLKRLREETFAWSNKNQNRASQLVAQLRQKPTIFRAVKLAGKHRQMLKEGDFSFFLLPFVLALSKDGIDIIPIIGNLFGLIISVYLFVFLFMKGNWKVRLIRFFLLTLDVIPVIGIFPFSTICVLHAFYSAKHEKEKYQKEILHSMNLAQHRSRLQ